MESRWASSCRRPWRGSRSRRRSSKRSIGSDTFCPRSSISTGARFGSFFYNVLDERGGSYMLYTLSGVPREAFANFPMPRATALFGPTFRGEGIVRIDDVLAHPDYGKSGPYFGMP